MNSGFFIATLLQLLGMNDRDGRCDRKIIRIQREQMIATKLGKLRDDLQAVERY